MAQEVTLNINKWLGIRNDGSGDTSLKKGELAQMQNFRINEGYNAVKRYGYSQILNNAFPSGIDGMWHGKVKGNLYTVVASNGGVYILNIDGTTTNIGTLTKGKTNFFSFGDALYLQNGYEYKRFTAETEEVPVQTGALFDTSSYAGAFPATVNVTDTGYYSVTLKGGKGTNNGEAQGGKGGTLKFRLLLNAGDTLEISKVEGSGKGVKFKKNGTVIGVVGGGGQAGIGFYFEPGADETYYYKGGDGGSSIGQDGTANIGQITAGKGANGITGGTVNGKDAPDGSGGTAPNGSTGGGGYAGGGGGTSSYTNPYLQGTASAGGGSSYLINTLTAIENSRGTNNDVESALITQTEELFYGFVDVTGYVPIIAVSSKPDGSNATMYEGINALTGKKRMRFNGDNTSTVYKLLETSITSVDKVYVGGVLKAVNTDYTFSLSAGTVTLTNVPATGIDNVEIHWTKGTGDREFVNKYTYAKLYGGKNDNRVFLFGAGNRLIFSGLADGIPSAEYFPVLNYMDIGSNQYEVTDLSVQYDRMLIHKEKGTWWTQYDFSTSLGASFPVYPLNDTIGSTAKGQSQIIKNNPHVLFGNTVYEFVASNVRDERNAKTVSDRVQPLLNDLDFKAHCLTFDNEKDGEYWLINENRVYIFNYKLDVWYYYFLADKVTAICETDLGILIGTQSGHIMRFDDTLTDNGVLINAFLETGWLNFGLPHKMKFLNLMWVSILPQSETACDVYYATNIRGQTKIKSIYNIDTRTSDFGYTDFADYTFSTNYDPLGFRIKPKAKKFTYIKFYILNEEAKKLTLLGITAPALVGGFSKERG